MPLKASSAKSMCCTVVGPTCTLSPPPVPLPPLSFSSHDLGALIGMSRWPALWIRATQGRICHPHPRIRVGGGCQPPVRGVLGPQRAALRPIANACWCKRRLARLPRCFGPRLQLRTYRSEAPCHALPLPLGIRWGPKPEARVRGAPVPPPTCIAHLSCTDSSALSSTAYGGLARRHSPTTDGVDLGPQSSWPAWWQPASWPAGSPKQSSATRCEHVLLQAPPSATFPLGCPERRSPCMGVRACGLVAGLLLAGLRDRGRPLCWIWWPCVWIWWSHYCPPELGAYMVLW